MVRIGATGHRVLVEHERVSAGIETALNTIDEISAGSALTVISSLAEGADRLIAKHIMQRPGALLIVPLPLPVLEYQKDFVSIESKLEFQDLISSAHQVIKLSAGENRESSYKAAGKFIVSNCDILLAVWDGRATQGEGGTAQVVELARSIQLPIAWIHAGNRKFGTSEPTSLGEEQGRVDFERLDRFVQRGWAADFDR